MRVTRTIVVTAGTIALSLFARTPSTNALTLPVPAALNGPSHGLDLVMQARTVCEKTWDGYQWTDQCRTVGTTRRYSHHSVRSRLRSLERRAMRYLRYGYW